MQSRGVLNTLCTCPLTTMLRCSCGTAFTVAVVSPKFEGLKLLQRHKLVSALH